MDRDILLSPNKTHQHIGKIIYFSPKAVAKAAVNDVEDSTPSTTENQYKLHQEMVVPWEEPLKHAIYLVLNNKVDDNQNTRFVIFC